MNEKIKKLVESINSLNTEEIKQLNEYLISAGPEDATVKDILELNVFSLRDFLENGGIELDGDAFEAEELIEEFDEEAENLYRKLSDEDLSIKLTKEEWEEMESIQEESEDPYYFDTNLEELAGPLQNQIDFARKILNRIKS